MRVVFGLILLILCGCATTKPIEPQKLAQIKKVGAISLLGDKINIVQVGTTVFNNVDNYEPVPQWEVDRFAVSEIERYLTSSRSYTVVPVAYQQNELLDIYKSQHRFPYADFDIDHVKEKLLDIGKRNGIDTLLLVLTSRRDVTGNNNFVYGYGAFSRSMLGAEIGSSFSLGATIAVLDLRTLEMLSVSPISSHQRLERGVWKASLSQYSPEDLAILKSYTLDGIKSAVPVSLEKLGFQK